MDGVVVKLGHGSDGGKDTKTRRSSGSMYEWRRGNDRGKDKQKRRCSASSNVRCSGI